MFRPRIRSLEPRAVPALVTWDGGAGTLNWADANNWSGNALPSAADDVEIDTSGTNDTVIYSGAATTVASLKVADSLRVSTGTLTVTGKFTAAKDVQIEANGASRAFQVNGPVAADGADFFAFAGGRVALTNLTAYDGLDAFFPNFYTDGATSKIELPNLTTLRASGGARVDLIATNGAAINASKLATVLPAADMTGTLYITANGAGSSVNVSALTSVVAAENHSFFIEAINGGAVTAPALTELTRGGVRVDAVSTLATAQFQQLQYVTLYFVGGNPSLTGLTDFTGGSIYADSGATVSVPVAAYGGKAAFFPEFRATGAGTTVAFPNLTTLAGPDNGSLQLFAYEGGSLSLPAVGQFTTGVANVFATGAASAVSLPSLTQLISPENTLSLVEAEADGKVHMPLLTTAARTRFTRDGAASTLNLNGLMSGNGCSFWADNGANFQLPGLTSYSGDTAFYTQFRAERGATLNLPNLSSLTGTSSGNLDLFAYSGGSLQLPLVTQLAAKNYSVYATGSDTATSTPSLVNLPALTKIVQPDDAYSYVEAEDGGKVNVPLLAAANRTRFTLDGAASSLNLDALADGNSCSFFADNAAKFTLKFTAYEGTAVSFPQFQATTGAELAFPSLAALKGATSGTLNVYAYSGGSVQLPLVAVLDVNSFSIYATGADSLVNLPVVTKLAIPDGAYSYVEAEAGGKVNVPLLISATRTQFTLDGADSVMNLTPLTNANTCSFIADNGAKFTLSSMTNYETSSVVFPRFFAYSGAELSLPNLTALKGSSDGGFIEIYAFAGGAVQLPLVTQFQFGSHSVYATGEKSLVNLPALTAVTPASPNYSYVEAEFGGTVAVPLLATASRTRFTLDGETSTLNLAALADADTSSFRADNKAKFAPTGLQSYDGDDGGFPRFDAYAGGVLSFPNLTAFQSSTNGYVEILAYSGGTISLPAVTQIVNRPVGIYAQDENSQVQLPVLTKLTSTEPTLSAAQAAYGGTVVAPVLATAFRTNFSVTGEMAAFDLPALTTADGCGFLAQLGADLTLPALKSYSALDSGFPDFRADSDGSKLSFPLLTTFNGSTNGYVQIRAYNSGSISMPGVTQLTVGGYGFELFNKDSSINLQSLTTFAPPEPSPGFVTLFGETTVTFSPQLTLQRASLRLHPESTVNTAKLTLQAGSLLHGQGLLAAEVVNGGEVRPDGDGVNGGLITLIGPYTQQASGRLSIEVYEAGDGKYDQLAVNGSITLGGELSLFVNYTAKPGDSYTFLPNDAADPINGQFSNLNPGQVVNIGGNDFRVLLTGGSGNDGVLTRLPTPPSVLSPVIEDGSAQRSVIRSVTYTFTDLVNFPATKSDAFQVTRTGPGGATGPVSVVVDTSLSTPTNTVAKLTFTGSLTEFKSLIDGNYTVTLIGAQITDAFGRQLDGDGDGQQGGNKVVDTHRLFGDFNGDRQTNFSDFLAFRGTFGVKAGQPGYLAAFDFDNDNDVDFNDFLAFRGRFGTFLSP